MLKTLADMLRQQVRRWAAWPAWAACAVLLCPHTAWADNDDGVWVEDGFALLRGYSLAVGGFVERGYGELSGWKDGHPLTPEAHGIRYFERNGLIAGTMAALVMTAAGNKAAYSPTKVEELSPKGSPVRVTRYTFHSEAERARILAATANTAANLFGNPDQSFDLQIYSRNLGGHADGWRANAMFIGFARPDSPLLLEAGLGYASVSSAVGADNKFLITRYKYLGMPVRLSAALGPVVGYLHFDWNWLGHSRGVTSTTTTTATGGTLTQTDTTGFPWRLGAQVAVLGRLYADVAVITPHLASGQFGFAGSACLKF